MGWKSLPTKFFVRWIAITTKQPWKNSKQVGMYSSISKGYVRLMNQTANTIEVEMPQVRDVIIRTPSPVQHKALPIMGRFPWINFRSHVFANCKLPSNINRFRIVRNRRHSPGPWLLFARSWISDKTFSVSGGRAIDWWECGYEHLLRLRRRTAWIWHLYCLSFRPNVFPHRCGIGAPIHSWMSAQAERPSSIHHTDYSNRQICNSFSGNI